MGKGISCRATPFDYRDSLRPAAALRTRAAYSALISQIGGLAYLLLRIGTKPPAAGGPSPVTRS